LVDHDIGAATRNDIKSGAEITLAGDRLPLVVRLRRDHLSELADVVVVDLGEQLGLRESGFE